MPLYLRDGSDQTSLRTAALRYKLKVKHFTSPSGSILTRGQPVSARTLKHQAPGRVSTEAPILKSLARLDADPPPPPPPNKKKSLRHKRESNLGSAALESDRLTTRPTTRSERETKSVQHQNAITNNAVFLPAGHVI